MERSAPVSVIGKDGLRGVVETAPAADGAATSPARIRFENGQQVLVPWESLVPQENGAYYLPYSLSELEPALLRREEAHETVLVVPVMVEELNVEKRLVETGRARITKTIQEREEVVDELLMREEVAIEHVPINRVLEGSPPPIRYEGDVMVVPLLEEVIVIEKRVMVKEELRISRRQTIVREPQPVTLRSEVVNVQRVEPSSEHEEESGARR